MFPPFYRFHCGDCVRVIRRCYNYRIDLTVHFVKHDSEVLESLSLGILFKSLSSAVKIDIAKCHNILSCASFDDRSAPATNPDSCDIQFGSRGFCLDPRWNEPCKSASGSRAFNETPAIGWFCSHS
jgi:hypothetical protein